MNKKAGIIVFIVAVGAAFFLLYSHRNSRQNEALQQPTKEEQDAAVAQALAHQSSNTAGIIKSNFANARTTSAAQVIAGTAAKMAIPPAGQYTPPEFSNMAPQSVLENMSRAIRQYGTMFGGNPVGVNAEFAKQLGGDNPKHINFISTEAGMRIDGDGELIDPWGTPYFFHQISGSDTEVHSAGPDKKMWTADDIVVH
jgi:hypothetical protein